MRENEAVWTKERVWKGLHRLAAAPPEGLEEVAGGIFSPDAGWLGSHPLNRLSDVREMVEKLWRPLKKAFPDLVRRDDIFMGGYFDGAGWISATGYYYGSFERDWLRIPATHDGLVLTAQSDVEGEKSLRLVEEMLFEGLVQPDRASMHMERYWTPDMMWYGPGLIRTTRGIDGFFEHHQEPWDASIPDANGGNYVSRFADGPYVASTGWPSIYATHTGVFFDIPPTGKSLQIRVMNWWRREGDLLAENWIFIDFPHAFLQLDIDLFARMARWRDARREG